MKRTPNLNLPQFEVEDKYRLEDYNEAYNVIDNEINLIDNEISLLNSKISTIETSLGENNEYCNEKVKDVYNDKRIFKCGFGHCVDWSFRSGNGGNWSEEKIKTEVEALKEYGVEEISVTIQSQCRDGKVKLVSDLELFKKCLDYARTLGIRTTMVKIHCNEFRKEIKELSDKMNLFNEWYALVETVSDYFEDYCEYFVPINEGEHIFTESQYQDFLVRCLNIGKEKNYKCGFTPSSATQWDALPQTVKNSCDFISFNCYPAISLKGFNTTYEDVMNGFEAYGLNQWINTHKIEYNKPIIITEIGVEDRPSCFASTFVWDFGNGESYNDGKIQKIMLKGIFETLKDNSNLDGFYYWFPFRGSYVKDVIKYYVGGNSNE